MRYARSAYLLRLGCLTLLSFLNLSCTLPLAPVLPVDLLLELLDLELLELRDLRVGDLTGLALHALGRGSSKEL